MSEEVSKYVRQQKVFELACNGVLPSDICKRLGIPKTTVYRDLKSVGIVINEFFEGMPEEQRRAVLTDFFNLTEKVQGQVAHLEGLRHFLSQFLVADVDGKPILNNKTFEQLMVLSDHIYKYVDLYGNLAGTINTKPNMPNTVIQNNVMVESNPEIEMIRQRYEQARQAQIEAIELKIAEKEGIEMYEARRNDSDNQGSTEL